MQALAYYDVATYQSAYALPYTKNYFRETSCIQRIPALFSEEMIDESGQQDLSMKDIWSDQKGNNMIMVLELIRVLVVPDHSNTAPNQVRARLQKRCLHYSCD